MQKLSFSLTAVASLLVGFQALAVDVGVEVNPTAPSYTNNVSLTTQNGYDIWINGSRPFDAAIYNYGSLLTTGSGFGIYATPFPTRGGTVSVLNRGTIQRIQLEEIDSAYILNNVSEGAGEPGVVQGSVLLGTNAVVENFSGVFENLATDENRQKGNLISFASGGFFNNGAETVYQTNEDGERVLVDLVLHKSILTTDRVQFGADGIFANGGTVDGKSLKMGHNATIMNVSDPYIQVNPGSLIEGGSTISFDEILLSDNAIVQNEMGAVLNADLLSVGNNAYIENGAGYNFVYANTFVVETETEITTESSTTDADTGENTNTESSTSNSTSSQTYIIPTIPHSSQMQVKNLVLGNGGALVNKHNSTYLGETIHFKDKGVLDLQSGLVSLTKENEGEKSELVFGNEGTLSVGVEHQNSVSVPIPVNESDSSDSDSSDSDDEDVKIKVEYEKVLDEQFQVGSLKADKITMGDGAQMIVAGGQVEAETIKLGDSSTLTVSTQTLPHEEVEESDTTDDDSDLSDIYDDLLNGDLSDIIGGLIGGLFSTPTPMEDDEKTEEVQPEESFVGAVTATEGIYLGNFSTLNLGGGTINSPIVKMLDDGKVFVTVDSEMNTLDMGKRAQVDIQASLTADVLLDSDSNVLLTDLYEDEEDEDDSDECEYCKVGGELIGSLIKKEGASNVKVTVQTSGEYYARLDGKIDVDSILIDTGLLEVAGDIKGDIFLNTDTTLRIAGTDMVIHDPISKLQDTTNTTVEVNLPDNVFYETTNTINVENLVLKNGGISINRPVTIDNILLNHDTTVRLTGNFNVGGIKEMYGDAVNTTLQIDGGKGKSINSSGTVSVDRLLITSGNYNAFHEISVAPTSGVVTVPQAEVEGVELGTDASLTAYANISVNRIVRDQEASLTGAVENTSLNVYSDHFQVKGNVDVDNLNMQGGVFEFLNDGGANVVNVTNDITLKPFSSLAGNGLLNVKNGNLDIKENSRLAVSMQDFDETPISKLHIVSSDSTIENAEDAYTKKDVVLETDSSAYIDVRANGNQSDEIVVSGTVRLADGTRILIRNIQENQEYQILSADKLEVNPDRLRTSFLWKGTSISAANDALTLKISDIQTLKEGIKAGEPSKNVDNLVDMMVSVRDSIGQYTIDPFLDNVYFAQTSEDAVKILNEYSPEGYLNTAQGALRMQRVFKESVLSEMNAMRNYRVKHDMNRSYSYYVSSPAYYGRPGRERYYQSFRQNRYNPNPYQERRTDRGGLWAKPFMVSMSQDDKDNQSGFDFDSYGFTAGIDRKIGVMTLGLTAMYATGEMEQKNKALKSDLTTYGIGAYASITPHYSRYFMDFYALWAQTSSSSTREIASLAEKAKADFDITAFTFGGDLGYEIMVTPNFVITPKVGIDFTSIQIDDIKEKGSGYAVASLKGTDFKSLQTPVELKAMLDFGDNMYRFRPEAHVRWTHEFMDTAAKTDATFIRYATPFVSEGLNVDKDTFTVGASLLWIYGLSELEVKYDYDFSSTSTGHSINLGYKYLF